MTPLLALAIFAAPALFPGHSPLAVWIGLTCIAVLGGLWWRADEMGGCETTLRATGGRYADLRAWAQRWGTTETKARQEWHKLRLPIRKGGSV
jgi:hypothetical protein